MCMSCKQSRILATKNSPTRDFYSPKKVMRAMGGGKPRSAHVTFGMPKVRNSFGSRNRNR